MSPHEVESRYLDGRYLQANPDWDRSDSRWKAGLVLRALERCALRPASICDVGCGAGEVLRTLRESFPDARLVGYDISPHLQPFWQEAAGAGIEFHVGNVASPQTEPYDVLLLLDVIEHLRDPFTFLAGLHGVARRLILHIPLDLSALSVLREAPLMNVREKVGHLHYFTRALALSLLKECGYRVISWNYTGAALYAPGATLKRRIAAIPRRIAYSMSHDLGARLLGGETLLVVAASADG